MPYLDKRSGRYFWGQVDLRAKGGGCPKLSFDRWDDAQTFEDQIRHAWTRGGPEAVTAVLDDYKLAKGRPRGTARPGYSFREIAEKATAAGGPKGKWLAGRDKPGRWRLQQIVDRIGDYDIDDLTLAIINEKVIEDLEKRPTHKGTRRGQADINRFLAALRGVLHFARKRGLTTHKIELPFNNDYLKAERFPVSFAEEERIVQWAMDQGRTDLALCWRWLAWTGMRPIELQRLTPEQIKDDHWVLRAFQTKKERQRTCYVSEELARQMRALIASGTLPNSKRLAETFSAAAKSAGTDLRVNLHSLRHTLNTRMAQAGVLKEIREFVLGHNRRDGNDIYTHLCAREHFPDRRAA